MQPVRPLTSALTRPSSILSSIGLILWARLLIDGVIRLQHMLVEDFEYYAVYESNYYDLAVSFLTFKPFEYGCEVLLGVVAWQTGALVQRSLNRMLPSKAIYT